MLEIVGCLFSKNPHRRLPKYFSGVAIAGFGAKEIFPTLQEFAFFGVANNVLNFQELRTKKISHDNKASIIPFAQIDLIGMFMEGVDLKYNTEIEKYLYKLSTEFPEIIISNIEKLDDDEKDEYKKKLAKYSNNMVKSTINKLNEYRREKYIDPVMEVVSFLSKDMLAVMAETLINLTTFRRKISLDAESVGGPTDVAIISKQDGFIWIKRKNYFETQQNPQYFKNYYKEKNIAKK